MSLQIRDKLLQWLLTKKYDNESVHNYMTRFRANTKSLHIAGGNNVIVNEFIMEMSW